MIREASITYNGDTVRVITILRDCSKKIVRAILPALKEENKQSKSSQDPLASNATGVSNS